MDLQNYIENIQRQLGAAAEAGGEEARALADRLVAPLDAAIRLALLEALTAAAEEITCELAPGSVEVRLRGRDPEFVVTPPPADPLAAPPTVPEAVSQAREPVADQGTTSTSAQQDGEGAAALAAGDEGGISRINLRMPEQLKARVERAAAGAHLSVNAWLVRAATSALDQPNEDGIPERRAPWGSQRYKGWAR